MARKPARPRRPTSTSAFRTYLKQADALADAVAAGELPISAAWWAQQKASNELLSVLGDVFHQRLVQPLAKPGKPLTIETYPVPRLRDLGDPVSYVHPARHPSADLGEPPARPVDPIDELEEPRPPVPPADPAGAAGGGE